MPSIFVASRHIPPLPCPKEERRSKKNCLPIPIFSIFFSSSIVLVSHSFAFLLSSRTTYRYAQTLVTNDREEAIPYLIATNNIPKVCSIGFLLSLFSSSGLSRSVSISLNHLISSLTSYLFPSRLSPFPLISLLSLFPSLFVFSSSSAFPLSQALDFYVSRNDLDEAFLVSHVESAGGFDNISKALYINIGDETSAMPNMQHNQVRVFIFFFSFSPHCYYLCPSSPLLPLCMSDSSLPSRSPLLFLPLSSPLPC